MDVALCRLINIYRNPFDSSSWCTKRLHVYMNMNMIQNIYYDKSLNIKHKQHSTLLKYKKLNTHEIFFTVVRSAFKCILLDIVSPIGSLKHWRLSCMIK